MKKKCCIITGISGGLGHSLAKIFYKSGIQVVGIDIKKPKNNNYINNFIKCDLNEFIVNDIYFNKIISEINLFIKNYELEVIINNAAYQKIDKVESLEKKDWSKSLNVNLLSPFFITKSFLNQLKKSKGSVFNISSIHSKLTKKHFSIYSTTKSALSALTRALSIDLGPYISFYNIEPAALDTDMLKKGFNNDLRLLNDLKSYHPSGTISNPDKLSKFIYLIYKNNFSSLQGSSISFSEGISNRLYDPN